MSQSASPAQEIAIAIQHHNAGRFFEAEAAYRQVLAADAENFDALHLLGVLRHQMGHHVEAIGLISRAINIDPSDAPTYFNLAIVYCAFNRMEEAIGCYRKALALKPDYIDAHYNLGDVLQTVGRLDEALASYKMAASLNPDFANAHNNAGMVYAKRGEWNEAILSFERALSIKPTFAEAYSNLGNALKEQGKLDEAIACCRKALSLNPGLVEAHYNLGNTLTAQGKLDEALDSYHNALSLNPNFADAHNNEGILHIQKVQWKEAIASFQRALAIKPSAGVYYNLGLALTGYGELAEALPSFEKALFLNPEYVEARWALTMAQIPLVYDLDAEPKLFLNAFSRDLTELASWFDSDSNRMAKGFKAVGVHQPFYLVYQEENHKALLSRYGDLCSRVMQAWQEEQELTPPVSLTRSKMTIGIVSAHIRNHSVWNAIIKGWLLQLDRTQFDLQIFYVGVMQDKETQLAKAQASCFEEGRKELLQWARTIQSKQLDVLIYPEIGMDEMTAKLASLRLAPVQVMTWGHPQTSGLPTIDYFLSAEDFEPLSEQGGQHAQEHYTEQLFVLPHLGCCYPALQVTAAAPNLASLGIHLKSPLLLCPGAPFKYAPQHDWILVEIARRLGQCQIIFVIGAGLENLSAKLRHRLDQVFTRSGLDFGKYVVFIPWQRPPEFYGLMQRVDVFLDTIGFSGFNTAMQAIECGLPIVTREGRFMRGRLASGILKRIGLPELVAESEEDYITLAVKLARDAEYRRHIHECIEANRHVLFNDTAPIKAMEEFLTNVGHRQISAHREMM